MNGNLEVFPITKFLLKEALDNNTIWINKSQIIPFSKSKAKWLIENDRIDDNDVCGIVGYENNELVSFVYLVPDFLNTNDGIKKVFWCRRWWISEKHKNTILPTYTMNVALEATKNQIVIKFLGKDVEAYYRKQPFSTFSPRVRYFILFNIDSNLLIRRLGFLKFLKPVFKRIDSISLAIINSINTKKVKKNLRKVKFDYLSIINSNTWEFINEYTADDIFPKSKNHLNWQVNNNQYTQAPINNKNIHNCLISSIEKNIYNINFSVIVKNEIVGFISVLIRNKEFVIRYFLSHKDYESICIDALIYNFIKSKTTSIQTENQALGEQIRKNYTNFYTDKRNLYALAHKDINFNFSEIKITDRDGHFA